MARNFVGLEIVSKLRDGIKSFTYSQKGQEQQEIHFEIIEIDDNVRLAVTSLTEGKDKYICIYLDKYDKYT